MADIYGQLVKAQFEHSTSDLSNVSGLVYYKSDTGVLKFYDAVGAAWRTVATTNNTITDVTTTRGDLIRRGAAALERFAAVTDNRVVRGDGTDVISGQIDDPDFFTTGAAAGAAAIGIVTTGAQTFAGAKTFTGAVLISAGSAAAPGLAFSDDADGSGTGIYRSGANQFSVATNGNERFRVDSGGGVTLGVGVNSEVTTHTVNGRLNVSTTGDNSSLFDDQDATPSGNKKIQVRFTGTADATGALFMTFEDTAQIGSISAASATSVAYNTTSDARLKTNVQDYVDGLSKVMEMKPRTYTWRKNGVEDHGFIAQELFQVYPGAVTVGRDDIEENGSLSHPWGVDYGKLTTVLVSAVQALKLENDALRARIDVLESQSSAKTKNPRAKKPKE